MMMSEAGKQKIALSQLLKMSEVRDQLPPERPVLDRKAALSKGVLS